MAKRVFLIVLDSCGIGEAPDAESFGDKGNGICASGYQIYALLLTLSSIGVPSAISKFSGSTRI